jgi:hypothetical protein
MYITSRAHPVVLVILIYTGFSKDNIASSWEIRDLLFTPSQKDGL